MGLGRCCFSVHSPYLRGKMLLTERVEQWNTHSSSSKAIWRTVFKYWNQIVEIGIRIVMKPLHWILIVLAALAGLVLFQTCSGGPSIDNSLPETEYTYRCNSCKKECTFTTKQITALKKAGKAVAVPGSMLKLECPNCLEIEAVPYEPYPF